jgi:hypothetical protein
MLRHQALVFDDFVQGAAYSGAQHARMLGMGDKLGIQVVLDGARIDTLITVAIEHSADGVVFVPKRETPEVGGTVRAPGLAAFYGGDDGTVGPSLAYVRLCIEVEATRPVRTRIHVAVRDESEGKLCGCGCAGGDEPGVGEAPDAFAGGPRPALDELERHLAAQGEHVRPRERMQRALAAMGAQERAEVVAFLEQMGTAAEHGEG